MVNSSQYLKQNIVIKYSISLLLITLLPYGLSNLGIGVIALHNYRDYSMMELASTMLAAFISLLSFTYFRTKENHFAFRLALVFGLTALLKAFYLFFYDINTPDQMELMENVTDGILITKVFNTIALFFAISSNKANEQNASLAWFYGTSLTACLIIVSELLFNLSGMFDHGQVWIYLFHKLPLAFLLVSEVLLLKKIQDDKFDNFQASLFMGLIPLIATEIYLPYDPSENLSMSFTVAHYLELLSFSLPIFGLLLDYMNFYSDEAQAKLRLQNISSKVAQEIIGSVGDIDITIDKLITGTRRIASDTKKADQMINSTLAESEETEQIIVDLYRNNEEVERMVGVIEEIALQTRVIALNASIEAERAGDAGKGFAIVAAEVNELSKQSKVSLKVIEDKLKLIQEGIGHALGFISKTTKSARSISLISSSIFKLIEAQEKSSERIANNIDEVKDNLNTLTDRLKVQI
jgi:hypothetical protein